MKFGRNLHLYRIPEWETSYIKYDQLKVVYKTATRNAALRDTQPSFGGIQSLPLNVPNAIPELYQHLDSEISAFSTFFTRGMQMLETRECDLRESYDLRSLSSSDIAIGLTGLPEVKDLAEALVELRDDLAKLRWYYRLNLEAITRIYSKVERFDETVMRNPQLKTLGSLEIEIPNRFNRFEEAILQISRHNSSGLQKKDGTTTKGGNLSNRRDNSDDDWSHYHELLEQKIIAAQPRSPQFREFLSCLCKRSLNVCSRKSDSHGITRNIAQVARDSHLLTHLVAFTGRSNHCIDRDVPRGTVQATTAQTEAVTSLFVHILNDFGERKPEILRTPDGVGRITLHYAAIYGLLPVCELILTAIEEEGGLPLVQADILTEDPSLLTPLHYAAIHGHATVTRLFLQALGKTDASITTETPTLQRAFDDALHIAIRSQDDNIFRVLVCTGPGRVPLSGHGHTALYAAAQIGRQDYVESLLDQECSCIDCVEPVHGWTPLFIAAIEGHDEVVRLLLHRGANQDIQDHRGWTAREHAAFRGRLSIALMFNPPKCGDAVGGLTISPSLTTTTTTNPSAHDAHSYLVVNLGSTQVGKSATPVDLDCCSSEYLRSSRPPDAHYSIDVSVPGTRTPHQTLSLPILSDMTNEPFVFPLKEGEEPKLKFTVSDQVYQDGHGAKRNLIGSGLAFLNKHEQTPGDGYERLIREQTVPILGKKTLECIGTVTFTFVIAKPFNYQGKIPPVTHQAVSSHHGVQLIGHRGHGQNTRKQDRLQIKENTMESFISAWNLGASLVEDLVPVIYHDFSVTKTGTDIPTHDLSLEQFLTVGEARLSRLDVASHESRQRSRSMSGPRRPDSSSPNTRDDIIQADPAILEELLVELPAPMGFNIEIKYPRLHSAQAAGIAPMAIELNKFLDTTLETVFRHAGNRHIIFSSFVPEVCILLSQKQQIYPVMLITNAGKTPVVDKEKRGQSLEIAIRFAKRWKLQGLVLASDTFVICPRLIRVVKGAGLECGSYGVLNNVPEHVKVQVDAGIDIVIVDEVGLIAKKLREWALPN
ncbi:hypothetical protein FQN50_005083 [Emmonsiellopsis sp. PD_5]|nr:hypothetical protein FQN50_005083 [Emmonsiellopsis sp. PD_5]